MKLIDRHILKNFLAPFIYILASLLGLFLVYDVSSKTARFLKHDVPFLAILRFYSLYIPQLIALGLPMVILLAIVLGVGKMSKNNEITAMRACGVSVLRIACPLFIAGLLLAGFGFLMFEKVVTKTYGETKRFDDAVKGRNIGKDIIHRGDFLTDESGSLLLFEIYQRDLKAFSNITWKKESDNPRAKITIKADMAVWIEDSWWASGVKVVYPDDRYRFIPKMKMYDWDFRPDDVTGEMLPEQRTLAQLSKRIKRYRATSGNVRGDIIQFHRRMALPLLNLIVVAVALPFALRGGRRGGSVAIGVGISMLLCLGYYGFSVLLSLLHSMPPWAAVWLPDALFGLGGLTATLRID
ncbi:YjgP/YjgQ family permease [bacterium]|nr:YjgP/YjgQ family permease [bacterium]